MTGRLPDEAKQYPHHFRPPHPSDTADVPADARAERPAGPRAPRPWWALVVGQWPLAVTLLGVAAGVGWAGIGHWKRGSFTVGAAFALGMVLFIGIGICMAFIMVWLPEAWIVGSSEWSRF